MSKALTLVGVVAATACYLLSSNSKPERAAAFDDDKNGEPEREAAFDDDKNGEPERAAASDDDENDRHQSVERNQAVDSNDTNSGRSNDAKTMPASDILTLAGFAAATAYYLFSGNSKPEKGTAFDDDNSKRHRSGRINRTGGYNDRDSDISNDTKNISYTNPFNNHDQSKKMHSTRDSAEREILRMQRQHRPGSERLNAYYCPEQECWFVGKRKYHS